VQTRRLAAVGVASPLGPLGFPALDMESPAVADGGYNNDRASDNLRAVECLINNPAAISAKSRQNQSMV
jgi:hypothetical protein